MRCLVFTLSVLLCALIAGCYPNDTVIVVNALAEIPFVDRTEKEINDWFDNRTIIDDKPMTSGGAVNGEPTVLLIKEGSALTINGTSYPGVLCITQLNMLPGGQQAKYAARMGIKVLNNPDLFECGQIELASCDEAMAANVTFLTERPLSMLEKAFRDGVNQWLQDDIVKTLKSTTNKEGFANPANAQPRKPAKVRGTFYNVTETEPPSPKVRSIGFFAE